MNRVEILVFFLQVQALSDLLLNILFFIRFLCILTRFQSESAMAKPTKWDWCITEITRNIWSWEGLSG